MCHLANIRIGVGDDPFSMKAPFESRHHLMPIRKSRSLRHVASVFPFSYVSPPPVSPQRDGRCTLNSDLTTVVCVRVPPVDPGARTGRVQDHSTHRLIFSGSTALMASADTTSQADVPPPRRLTTATAACSLRPTVPRFASYFLCTYCSLFLPAQVAGVS